MDSLRSAAICSRVRASAASTVRRSWCKRKSVSSISPEISKRLRGPVAACSDASMSDVSAFCVAD
jgi:hypothetical protein